MYLRSKYGLSAYSIYFMIVEIMHEQTDGKLSCKLLDGLCQQLNVDKTLLNDFYNDAIACELFKTDGEKYWSNRVLRNKEHLEESRTNKSNAGKKGAAARWNKEENSNAIADACECNSNVITENGKVKESKVKESKENISSAADEFKKVVSIFNNNIHSISQIEADKLSDWLNDMTSDVIIAAITEAVTHKARSMAYIETILRDWNNKGIKTKIDLESLKKSTGEIDKPDPARERARRLAEE
jgi:DnaD/phage-associated family protein